MSQVITSVTSYLDNGKVVFVKTAGTAAADCEWEIQFRGKSGKWVSSTCVARSVPGKDMLLMFFASVYKHVRAVSVVRGSEGLM